MDYHAINIDNGAVVLDYVCRACESGNLDYMDARRAVMVVGAAACGHSLALLRIADNPGILDDLQDGLETATTIDDWILAGRVDGDITIDNIDTP